MLVISSTAILCLFSDFSEFRLMSSLPSVLYTLWHVSFYGNSSLNTHTFSSQPSIKQRRQWVHIWRQFVCLRLRSPPVFRYRNQRWTFVYNSEPLTSVNYFINLNRHSWHQSFSLSLVEELSQSRGTQDYSLGLTYFFSLCFSFSQRLILK